MEWIVIGIPVVVAFAFLMGVLYDYEIRKLFARMQSRRGPLFIVPRDLRGELGTTRVFQTLYDILKLYSKRQTFRPSSSKYFIAAPFVALGCMVLATTLLDIGGISVFGDYDFSMVVISYLLFTIPLSLIIGGASSSSPFGALSVRREIELMLSYEVAFVIGIFSAALLANSLSIARVVAYQANTLPFLLINPFAAAAVFFAIVGKLHLKPFDTTEAEAEIVSGYFTEYSSRLLGTFLASRMLLLFVLVTLFIDLFVFIPVVPLLLYFVEGFLFVLALTLVHTVMPRYRIDQAVSWFTRIPLVLALIGLVWSLTLKYGLLGAVG